jgi:DNA-binding NtrC family response regulator
MELQRDPPRRILIVDDDARVRSALRRTLTGAGYRVSTAGDASEALDRLKAEPVDMVISDQLMPEMRGVDFLKLVRSRYPDCPRLLLTAHADFKTAIEAINQGEVWRLLAKPWDEDELLAALHVVFEQVKQQAENRRLLAYARQHPDLLGRYHEHAATLTP